MDARLLDLLDVIVWFSHDIGLKEPMASRDSTHLERVGIVWPFQYFTLLRLCWYPMVYEVSVF